MTLPENNEIEIEILTEILQKAKINSTLKISLLTSSMKLSAQLPSYVQCYEKEKTGLDPGAQNGDSPGANIVG